MSATLNSSPWRAVAHRLAAPFFPLISSGLHALADCLPSSLLLNGAGGGPLVLFYHAVSDVPLPHIENLFRIKNVHEFESDLDYLLSEFRPITLDDLKSSFLEGSPLPERAFYLTFDDGLREISEIVAPILKRKGIHATFFISSRFLGNRDLSYRFKTSLLIGRANEPRTTSLQMKKLETLLREARLPWTGNFAADLKRVDYHHSGLLDKTAEILEYNFYEYLSKTQPYMTVHHVRSLVGDGFAIGSHSMDHPPYAQLNLEEQLYQTREGARQLKQLVGVDHKLFAFPFSEIGVSNDFYNQIFDEGTVQLFFGTSGWSHQTDRHIVQRISLEGEKPSSKIYIQHSMIDSIVNQFLHKWRVFIH